MTKFQKFLITLVIFINSFYMIVRFLSIPIFEGIFSFVIAFSLFLAEFLGFFAYIIYIYVFTGKKNIKTKTLSNLNGHIPTVDIFICTYNEKINLLSKTIMAAKQLNYPKDKYKIYVLDDGNRQELHNLCTDFFNVNYISRSENINAKAGNINNALKQTSGELFVVLDADMICKTNFLQETVGYFSDPNMAFVQTPQTYYNQDIYQYNISKKFNNEQDFFMRYIQPARDSKNSMLHIGTNAIFRRKHVEKIGLYPTKSITEDMALGALLQANGYNSVFINKTLACGLSACTYPELIKQRDRWCRGNLQVLRNYKKEIFKKLNFKQKMIYIDGVLYWLSGLTKLIFIITPIIFLLTGITIVNLPPKYLFPLFVLAFSSQILLSKYILPKKISSHYFKFFMRGEFYNTIIAPHLSFSVLKHFFFSDMKFNVTPKNLSKSKGHYHVKFAITHFILLILGIISIIIGTTKLGNSLYLDSYLINVFWVCYNIPGLILSLKIAYQPPRNLANEGITVYSKNQTILHINKNKIICNITEISDDFVKIALPNNSKDLLNYNNVNIKKILSHNKLSICIENSVIPCEYVDTPNFKNIITLKFKKLSYDKFEDVMKVLVRNIRPYKYNLF